MKKIGQKLVINLVDKYFIKYYSNSGYEGIFIFLTAKNKQKKKQPPFFSNS